MKKIILILLIAGLMIGCARETNEPVSETPQEITQEEIEESIGDVNIQVQIAPEFTYIYDLDFLSNNKEYQEWRATVKEEVTIEDLEKFNEILKNIPLETPEGNLAHALATLNENTLEKMKSNSEEQNLVGNAKQEEVLVTARRIQGNSYAMSMVNYYGTRQAQKNVRSGNGITATPTRAWSWNTNNDAKVTAGLFKTKACDSVNEMACNRDVAGMVFLEKKW